MSLSVIHECRVKARSNSCASDCGFRNLVAREPVIQTLTLDFCLWSSKQGMLMPTHTCARVHCEFVLAEFVQASCALQLWQVIASSWCYSAALPCAVLGNVRARCYPIQRGLRCGPTAFQLCTSCESGFSFQYVCNFHKIKELKTSDQHHAMGFLNKLQES